MLTIYLYLLFAIALFLFWLSFQDLPSTNNTREKAGRRYVEKELFGKQQANIFSYREGSRLATKADLKDMETRLTLWLIMGTVFFTSLAFVMMCLMI